MILGIDHVQLAAPAGCEVKARWFFGDILGLQEHSKPPELATRGGCWFQCGNQQLHIGVEQDFAPARKAHPAFAVRDLEGLKELLSGNGIAFKGDDANPDVRRIFVSDPWDNRLEFVQIG